MAKLGQPDWFQLGDKDLATHITRSGLLRDGKSLTLVTKILQESMGIDTTILPMCEHPRPTVILTEEHGELAFQDWFVRLRCQPKATGFRFDGEDMASQDVLDALDEADWILLTPSNPFVSIDPILTLNGVKARLQQKPVIAVSPILGNDAVKGPLAKIFKERDGQAPSAKSVLDHYGDLIDVFVVHTGDAFETDKAQIVETDILMKDIEDRGRLAAELRTIIDRFDEVGP